ncbi:unnamed protein product [Microthlaspi erraticum]|uniref:J domain-containing protein n=1 Tax=Microthlaspi erraticum TaxID=1685480 RepID=A0A6D2KDP2_9BRAS|nr:unnamed protein product [Microthlaspi erraticum]
MECNKDEAKRALDIAEKKLSQSDYDGAKRFVKKAETLYPNLDGLKQFLMMINVYIDGGKADWYGVLGIDDPLADDETVKKQYKKLALLLHPDKNKFKGAEGAFKLVSQAWCLLSDKVKRDDYDLKRKPKAATTNGMPKPPNANAHKPKEATTNGNQTARNGVDTSAKAKKPKPVPNPKKRASSSAKPKPAPAPTFWTMCNGCKTRGEYVKQRYLDKAIICPNCGHVFVATENTWIPSSAQQQRQRQSDQNKANGAASSSPFVGGTAKFFRPQVNFAMPGFNYPPSPQQCSAQNTSGANEKILKKPKTHHL